MWSVALLTTAAAFSVQLNTETFAASAQASGTTQSFSYTGSDQTFTVPSGVSSVSNGLRPIPPPCLGYGSMASWMSVGISWEASRGLPGGSFDDVLGASRGIFWASYVPIGASWGPLGDLGVSWGPLGASCGPLVAEGSDFRFAFPLLGLSWSRLGRPLGRLGALFGLLGALLGASWAVLGSLENAPESKTYRRGSAATLDLFDRAYTRDR